MNRPHGSTYALIFGLAVLSGLLISLKLLQASSAEEEIHSLDSLAEQVAKEYDFNEAFTIEQIERLRRAEEERSLLAANAALLRALQNNSDKTGEPFVRLSCGGLFLVNEKGNVLSPKREATVVDVPILSGNGFKIDPKTHRLSGRSFSEAIQFIRAVRKKSRLLAHQLSEVHCDATIGLVVYFSHTGSLPIIIGHDQMEEKGRRIVVLFEQLGASELVAQARYVDARLKGQLVVKRWMD